MKIISRFFVILTFITSMSFAGLNEPLDGSVLNYIHVLFEWDQMEQAVAYNLQVSENSDFTTPIIDVIDSTLIYIDQENIDWEQLYYCRLCPVYDGGSLGDWCNTITFSTGSTRSNASATMYDIDNYSSGLTIFGSFFDYFSAVIDQSGAEIWNSGDNSIVYYNNNNYGQLFGCQYNEGFANNIPGIEFSIGNDIIWQDPNDEFVHHDIIQLPNGNYLGIGTTTQFGPIPIGDWTYMFQTLGYIADGVTPEFPWIGDRIVEWDQETHEVVWSWDTFDHFSMQDYDAIGGSWDQAFSDQQFDWTHANALLFDETESAIYLSVRHLSRITKIDYPSGDVIWNMGLEMPSGDVGIGNELGFSFQHGLQILENGNIVTFDNGNLSVILLDTPEPTSRALEIQVSGSEGSYSAEIIWEHSLPEDLFGFASGNTQKLENGNYLITTVGGGGTSLEIAPDHDLIWQGHYNLSLPSGAVYRANRISGLHPIGFSLMMPEFVIEGSEPTIYLNTGVNTVEFIIHNEGNTAETFDYLFSDDGDWFENSSGSVLINSGEHHILTFSGIIVDEIESHIFELVVTPTHNTELEKSVSITAYSVVDQICDPGYTYIEELPYTVTILGGGENCFLDTDLNALDDVITGNELELESAIHLGRQTWLNGRLIILLAGNFSTGGGIVLNSLPESFGDLDGLMMLYIYDNILTSLPESFGQLLNLLVLEIQNNQLTGLHENFGNLVNLETLDLGYNQLTSLPDSFINLQNLEYLWLFANQLTELPDNFCSLNLNWNDYDNSPTPRPYFAIGGNYLCNDVPECVLNSQFYDKGIDLAYYIFVICMPQDCGMEDVNQDGVWDILDAVRTVFFILDELEPTCIEFACADLNNDNVIDILDIIIMVELILTP